MSFEPSAVDVLQGGGDSAKFEEAFKAQDIEAYVKLLKSTQPIDPIEGSMHPWAEGPKTIGALSGTQLTVLAERGDEGVKETLRRCGAVEELVAFLRSDETDRVQTAVIALSFVTSDSAANATAAHNAGALPLLMDHLDSEISGMRIAAAATLCNICFPHLEYRREFKDRGGFASLVNQLDYDPDQPPDAEELQLEAVANLAEMIETPEDGIVIQEFAKAAVEAGAIPKLRVLAESEGGDMRTHSTKLLEHLERASAA